MKNYFLLFALSLLSISCARVGSPVGGKKDTLAPKFLRSNIDSTRVNVGLNTKELRLDFDKYIVLKDINKNLTISPPIKKIKRILPSNMANKFVLIQWEDTLKANTTYNFNFGNSIADNNEGNVLSYFNFAFSTGKKLDDLYISGEAKDALKIKDKRDAKPIVVGLYPAKDSMDYKQKPYYITKADEDGYFELNYLSKGKYYIIAFEDDNGNSIYDMGKEKVGFLKEPIDLEKNISGLKLPVFPAQKNSKLKEIKNSIGGVLFLFEGNPEKITIQPISDKLKDYKIIHQSRSDSATVWFDAHKENIGTESPEGLKFSYQINDLPKKETTITYKAQSKDDLTLNSEETNLAPEEKFVINSNYELNSINTEKWTLKMDSLTVQPFTATISPTNPNQILVKSDFKPGKKYQLIVPKETVNSYYKRNSKSYLWDITSQGIENFGRVKITVSPLPNAPFWLKLYNGADEVVYHKKSETATVDFDILKPGTYYLKIFIDENKNGVWDEANFEKRQFAEPAKVYYKPIIVKPLWEMVETWDLNNNQSLDTSANAILENDSSLQNNNKQEKNKIPTLKSPTKSSDGNNLKLRNP
ncbi:MAG: Ig-like domain-containing protein [Bacteroidetes bacterium]|jgi:uncharacterized protein (DUF2141 family)|nr:Ig-like domain-containing protein [Bacteroidota bacterium]